MTLQLGETAPDFTVASTEGNIQFHEWLGDDWAVLFSHPADYTPVCTTELGAFAKRKDEFASRGVKLIGVSVDPLDSHNDWAKDIEKTQGTGLNFGSSHFTGKRCFYLKEEV
ncbi:redoxin domain-containing protein, partial [Marinobacter salarius]|uniref:redoxin domain-containing protein n=1 Tax=Marinobacter salarius TaxID=1420917 RepID=UPI0025A3AAC6